MEAVLCRHFMALKPISLAFKGHVKSSINLYLINLKKSYSYSHALTSFAYSFDATYYHSSLAHVRELKVPYVIKTRLYSL